MSKYEASLDQLKKAISRLEEVLKVKPVTSIIRDSAIQRFEFCMDLSWKTLKTYLLEKKGITCTSPKDCFRESYKQKLIEKDDSWIKLVDMRNETVHTYNEKIAEEIFAYLPKAYELFTSLLASLKES